MCGNKKLYFKVKGLRGEQNNCTYIHTYSKREIVYNFKFYF